MADCCGSCKKDLVLLSYKKIEKINGYDTKRLCHIVQIFGAQPVYRGSIFKRCDQR